MLLAHREQLSIQDALERIRTGPEEVAIELPPGVLLDVNDGAIRLDGADAGCHVSGGQRVARIEDECGAPPAPNPKISLNPDAPGLDEATRQRRRALAKLQQMTARQVFDLAVRAGIYTKDGELTPAYASDAEPSASRPTD
jgi:hypothetical protein